VYFVQVVHLLYAVSQLSLAIPLWIGAMITIAEYHWLW